MEDFMLRSYTGMMAVTLIVTSLTFEWAQAAVGGADAARG
jgi:hypothetical protein